MAIDHPAAREELAHFSQALSVIAQEQEGAQERLDDARAALDAARRFDPDNLRNKACANCGSRGKNRILRAWIFTRKAAAPSNITLAKMA